MKKQTSQSPKEFGLFSRHGKWSYQTYVRDSIGKKIIQITSEMTNLFF
ncbi:MAG: hypothetical protein N4A57_03490 [Anaeromicrobium sp.]|jgi:hypothetical protein|nr:hypothetical protein [Anaeromicrobium sp.]MCT4593324.1 hypothetical protein [Anaeromicrobium sp.]